MKGAHEWRPCSVAVHRACARAARCRWWTARFVHVIEAAAPGGGAPTHPVLCAPAEVAAAAASLLASTGASLTLAEVQSAYLELQAATAAVEAAKLHLVRMLVEHERPHRRKAPGTQTKGWLERAARLGRGAATAEVAAARATDPDTGTLRGLGAALAAGEVSRQHVDVAARVLPRLPQRVLDERRETVDDHLTEQARGFSPSDTDTLAKHLRTALARRLRRRRRRRRRRLARATRCLPRAAAGELVPGLDGDVAVPRSPCPRRRPPPVVAALSGLSAPTPSPRRSRTTTRTPEPEPDTRTTTQRKADAVHRDGPARSERCQRRRAGGGTARRRRHRGAAGRAARRRRRGVHPRRVTALPRRPAAVRVRRGRRPRGARPPRRRGADGVRGPPGEPRAAPRPGRSRRRLRLPRLQRPAELVRGPPHRVLEPRRGHCPRQPGAAVLAAPHRGPPRAMDDHRPRRGAVVRAAALGRPREQTRAQLLPPARRRNPRRRGRPRRAPASQAQPPPPPPPRPTATTPPAPRPRASPEAPRSGSSPVAHRSDAHD